MAKKDPHLHHPVESYDHMQGEPMDPADHPVDNIPPATDDRWGEMLEAMMGQHNQDER